MAFVTSLSNPLARCQEEGYHSYIPEVPYPSTICLWLNPDYYSENTNETRFIVLCTTECDVPFSLRVLSLEVFNNCAICANAILHHVSKNVPILACNNFNIHERIFIFFGRNVTDKASNQKTLYYVTSNNLCLCTTWQNGKTRKLHFSLK